MVNIPLVSIIAFLSAFVPGVLFSLALLRKTKLSLFEILVIGFIFGLIAAPTLTWLESYLANYIPDLDYSLSLFAANVAVLSIAGLVLCWQQGVFKDVFKSDPLKDLHVNWVWVALLILMLIAFATRLFSIGISPKFFEFDPYFDMLNTEAILTYGYQPLYTTSAWPVLANGSLMRIQPLVPYLEAYWYDLANTFGAQSKTFDTTLMSYVGSIYPPITAALLVFVIFVLLYYEYDKRVGLIGAALATTMPILFTTFIAGEQLLEPWGILTLFFFFATYMLAVRDMKNKRFAILAGIAFASTFLGAHYYTVDAGVLSLYIIIQGAINFVRGESNKDFYKMNIIVLAIIAVFLALYEPYSSALSTAIPQILGVPLTIAGPVAALVAVMLLDYIPKELHKRQIIFKNTNLANRLVWLIFFAVVLIVVVLSTSLRKPIISYIELSAKFTTPSSALFMTVQEFIPTGLLYDFGSAGFGIIGASIYSIPLTVWLVSAVSMLFIILNILFKNSKTGVLYLAIALPLMFASFSEVKYLPHFGAAYIVLFGIILGELLNIAHKNFALKGREVHESPQQEVKEPSFPAIVLTLFIGLFVISPIFAFVYLLWVAYKNRPSMKATYLWLLIAIFVIVEAGSLLINHSLMLGEISSIVNAIKSAYIASTAGSQACNIIARQGGSVGYDLYCNVVPQYWLSAMSWLKDNVGPHAPRVLSWWDYGDWINWFGNSFAVLRGDNAVALEDYAVAATFVLDPKDGYSPQSLANLMNTNQTGYVLFDQDLVQKWQALDFLACVHVNATSRAYAIAQGKAQPTPTPYLLGSSPCELAHDPQFVLLPYITNSSPASLNFYCSISNSSVQYLRGYLVSGQTLSNGTVCVNPQPNTKGVLNVYNENGTKLNAVIQEALSSGLVQLGGVPFIEILMIYLPNGPNATITNAPSGFYLSNFYNGFFLGNLTGFTQVYPVQNTTGINMVNFSAPVRIFKLDHFTGSLPKILPKPSYVQNNYTMPA